MSSASDRLDIWLKSMGYVPQVYFTFAILSGQICRDINANKTRSRNDMSWRNGSSMGLDNN